VSNRRRLPRALLGLVLPLLCGGPAAAAPVAHVLRVDPLASIEDGAPLLTTVIDLTESRRVGEVVAPCASLSGEAQLDCMATALEAPGALFRPHPLPSDRVALTVAVEGAEVPASYVSHRSFGESQGEPRVGTAWLIVVDAESRMADSFDAARALARRFVESMGPADLVDVVVLGDQQLAKDTRWLARGDQKAALALLSAEESTYRSQGRTRPLLSLLRQAARDAFGTLGGESGPRAPLHQAMVVISTGYGGGDPSTTGPGAAQLSEYLTRGRLSEENTAVPKLPLPLISVFVPPKAMPEQRQLAQDFMQGLANPDIGGFFTVLRRDQPEQPARVVDAVRSRFSAMVVARFTLSCVAPTSTQSFALLFPGATPAIIGDSSFKDVPVGFDPRDWPLDVDAALTERTARAAGGVHPGGTLRVFGSFCWGGDLARPEVYFLPPGERLPADLGASAQKAREVQKRLTSLDLRGVTVQAGASFAEFQVPDTEQILHGQGERRVVRLVVVDTSLQRSSGLTEATVLQLPGAPRPVPRLYYLLGGAGLLMALGALALFIGSARGRRAPATATPRPTVTDSPYARPAPVTRSPRKAAPAGTRATIEGPAGRFTVLAGSDLRVGRDGARCAAVLASPQVSGLHATFRFEQSRLLVRDEGSTAGTRVGGEPITAGQWVELEDGAEVQLGSERLRVTLGRGAS
jgi:hypothetical protein